MYKICYDLCAARNSANSMNASSPRGLWEHNSRSLTIRVDTECLADNGYETRSCSLCRASPTSLSTWKSPGSISNMISLRNSRNGRYCSEVVDSGSATCDSSKQDHIGRTRAPSQSTMPTTRVGSSYATTMLLVRISSWKRTKWAMDGSTLSKNRALSIICPRMSHNDLK